MNFRETTIADEVYKSMVLLMCGSLIKCGHLILPQISPYNPGSASSEATSPTSQLQVLQVSLAAWAQTQGLQGSALVFFCFRGTMTH